jgi:hypothetical protein
MLRDAEELGLRIESAEREGRGAVQLRRQAERLQSEAMDLEVELLAKREDCRRAAGDALPLCLERLRALEATLKAGRAGQEEARDMLRLREARGRLQAGISGPAVLGYPLLPPDSTDTQESLRAKLQYHEEVASDLRNLAGRVDARAKEVGEERRTLAEARRFLEDIGFLDEGGRVTAGGSAQFRGMPGTPGGPDDVVSRVVGGAEVSGAGGNLELVLGWTPATPEESDHLLRVLEGYRGAIRAELEAVERNLAEIRARVLPGVPANR